jgi:hypothetical protein
MSAIDPLLAGCQIALATAFSVAAAGKWHRRDSLDESLLRDLGVPRALAVVAAPVLPVAELGVAVLVLFPGTVKVGAVLAFLLLVGFSGFLAIALLRGWRGHAAALGRQNARWALAHLPATPSWSRWR